MYRFRFSGNIRWQYYHLPHFVPFDRSTMVFDETGPNEYRSQLFHIKYLPTLMYLETVYVVVRIDCFVCSLCSVFSATV